MEGLSKVDYELLHSLGLVIGDPERVLLCTHASCGYALQIHDKRVSRHLWGKNQTPKASRRGLDRLILSLKLCDPRLVDPRPHGLAPHPHLQISTGYRCRQCQYLTISSKLCQQHRCSPLNSVCLPEKNRISNIDKDV